jgi:hypothetical protein
MACMRPYLVLGLLACGACNWISLGINARRYETLAAGDAGNIVVRDTLAYVTLGDSGFAVVHADRGDRIGLVPPTVGFGSVDDVAISGDLLFALDARPPGALSVYSLASAASPALLTPVRGVPVGPFSGVSAGGGMVVVSGGTSLLTAWRHDSDGILRDSAQIDLGRGQPDVLVSSGGDLFVSTHYRGPYFGLDVARRDPDSGKLQRVAQVPLDGAGFTTGGSKPASFPIEAALLDSATLLVANLRGVSVLNVQDAARARLTRTIDVGGPAVNVDALGGVAAVVVAGRAPAVVFIDFTGPEVRVVRRVTLPPGTKPAGVALSRHSVLVAARGQKVLAVKR